MEAVPKYGWGPPRRARSPQERSRPRPTTPPQALENVPEDVEPEAQEAVRADDGSDSDRISGTTLETGGAMPRPSTTRKTVGERLIDDAYERFSIELLFANSVLRGEPGTEDLATISLPGAS